MATRKRYDQGKGAKRLARERVGSVPPARPIEPKAKRKKPKHKTPPGDDGDPLP